MEYLLCYDIVEDDLRQRVADLCMAKGLVRIQYSVFFGSISSNKADTLLMQIKDEIKNKDAAILLIELCQTCAKKKKIVVETKTKTSSKSKNQSQSATAKSSSSTTATSSSAATTKPSSSATANSSKARKKPKKRRKARVTLERLQDYQNKGVIIL